ncbi:hypothetical protein [Bradyrhizobium centrolobii]|uniref:hypothetical protein n=1 Tax=Bradyrhizobium centrolobii TaxID=1505087 RepID=UPI0010A9765D|nr:hypothetical protein [Bradyrhizobium centrolobii]
MKRCGILELDRAYVAIEVKAMRFGGSSFFRVNCYRPASTYMLRGLATDADHIAKYEVADSLKTLDHLQMSGAIPVFFAKRQRRRRRKVHGRTIL